MRRTRRPTPPSLTKAEYRRECLLRCSAVTRFHRRYPPVFVHVDGKTPKPTGMLSAWLTTGRLVKRRAGLLAGGGTAWADLAPLYGMGGEVLPRGWRRLTPQDLDYFDRLGPLAPRRRAGPRARARYARALAALRAQWPDVSLRVAALPVDDADRPGGRHRPLHGDADRLRRHSDLCGHDRGRAGPTLARSDAGQACGLQAEPSAVGRGARSTRSDSPSGTPTRDSGASRAWPGGSGGPVCREACLRRRVHGYRRASPIRGKSQGPPGGRHRSEGPDPANGRVARCQRADSLDDLCSARRIHPG